MKRFIETILLRNELLFWFGLLCFILAILFLLLSRYSEMEVMGANAWFKPVKFALSIWIYSWTMAWYMHYLGPGRDIRAISWIIVVMLGFEIVYIALQAARGQLSHFNTSTPLYAGLYAMMAAAATIVTLGTAYTCVQFCQRDFPDLPGYYVWSIRLGMLLFVVFSFEGFVMGSRLSHTIGGPDGGRGLPFLNWSQTYGDPRVAHFIGMHALQALPLLSHYLLKSIALTLAAGLLYALLALFVLVQALQGHPFLKG